MSFRVNTLLPRAPLLHQRHESHQFHTQHILHKVTVEAKHKTLL